MLGRAAVAMWWDVAPEVRAEWEDWHTHEHMAERLAIRGFLRGTRWVAGEGEYFVLYELARRSVLSGPHYLERLNHPTPWSRKMMPHHRNMVRSLCRVRASFGGGLPQALATTRFSVRRGRGPALAAWLQAELAGLAGRRGLACAHLLQAERHKGPPTAEQQIRGGDAQAQWVLLVGGYDTGALAQVVLPLADHGADHVQTGCYRPAYSLASREIT